MAYNKITLYGGQVCDYMHIQGDAVIEGQFEHVNDEPAEWGESTILYANFSNKDYPLCAGDSKVIGNIDGYEIYRRKYNQSYSEYIGTVHKSENDTGDVIVDYSARNGVDYTYYLYPNINTYNNNDVRLAPFITKQLAINCPYWSLFIVDETDEENVFYLDKMFKFELNLEVGELSNNAGVNILQNFTKYPTVQHGSSNYWSGSLSSLCGFISCNYIDYIQNVNMIDELKQISSSNKRKFLKDIDGNMWEVDISAPITISTENMTIESLKTWTFSWVEVGDAANASIINNPTKTVVDWVLTESGVAVPYYNYIWGEQYRWDNSLLWTTNNNEKKNNTHLGREILEWDGD